MVVPILKERLPQEYRNIILEETDIRQTGNQAPTNQANNQGGNATSMLIQDQPRFPQDYDATFARGQELNNQREEIFSIGSSLHSQIQALSGIL